MIKTACAYTKSDQEIFLMGFRMWIMESTNFWSKFLWRSYLKCPGPNWTFPFLGANAIMDRSEFRSQIRQTRRYSTWVGFDPKLTDIRLARTWIPTLLSPQIFDLSGLGQALDQARPSWALASLAINAFSIRLGRVCPSTWPNSPSSTWASLEAWILELKPCRPSATLPNWLNSPIFDLGEFGQALGQTRQDLAKLTKLDDIRLGRVWSSTCLNSPKFNLARLARRTPQPHLAHRGRTLLNWPNLTIFDLDEIGQALV